MPRVSDVVPLGHPDRKPTDRYPQLRPLDIVGPRGGWDYARRLGGYPELEWSYSLLTERAWMLSSQAPALFYEPVSTFDQVREVASLGYGLSPKGDADPDSVARRPHVSIGFRYFDRFYRTATGRPQLPRTDERLRGRHVVRILAPTAGDELWFANTWGPGWGDGGSGYMSREYFDVHVTTAWANWNSYLGPSPKMFDCLRVAERGRTPRPDRWLECWPTRNDFWVDEMLIGGRRHSTVSWAVRSFDDYRPVYVFELRNPARVVGRLHLHGPAAEGEPFSIRELFILPSSRRRGLGTVLETTAVERVRELGGRGLEAWIHTPDDLPRTAPASRGFAARRGYSLEPYDRTGLDVTTIARKEVSG
jgi:GNAT superfamily N-acetyltransferase